MSRTHPQPPVDQVIQSKGWYMPGEPLTVVEHVRPQNPARSWAVRLQDPRGHCIYVDDHTIVAAVLEDHSITGKRRSTA